MGSRERERRAKKERKTQRGRNKTREEERRGQESFPLLLFLPPLPFHALFCKNRGLVPCFVLILKDWVVAFSAAGGGRRKERGETNKNLLSPSLSHIFPISGGKQQAWSRRLSCGPRRVWLVPPPPHLLLLLVPLQRLPCPAPCRLREGGKLQQQQSAASIGVIIPIVDTLPFGQTFLRLTTMTRRLSPPTSSEAPPSPGLRPWSAQLGSRASIIYR